MQEITVYDVHGNTLTNLVQFDTNVHICINDSRITAAYQVQFFNSTSERALVMDSTYKDGILDVKIPNDLLEQPYAINGYVRVEENGEGKCLYGFKIAVRKKPQPYNWVHVDSHDYVTFAEIIDECKQFAAAANDSSTKAKNSEIAASKSATNAKASENNAASSASAALISEKNAKASETHASNSETNAKESEKASAASVIATKEYAKVAERAESNALQYERASNEYAAASKSYAVGGASDLILDSDGNVLTTSDGSKLYMTYFRDNEDTENAKYYYEQSKVNAQNSKTSESNALASATNAKTSENNATSSASAALLSEQKAKASENASATSEANAKTSESNSKTSEINAKQSEINSKKSEENSKTSENNALQSEINAKNSEVKAAKSEDNTSILESNSKEYQLSALSSKEYAKQYMDRAEKAMVDNEKYAKLSQSYATGDASDCLADSDNNTIITDDGDIICFSFYRENEEIDNARYYYEQSKRISMGLSGALIPMGTITYEELALQTKQSGYMYNISNEFTTDNTFKEGAGFTYPAGTNVYYTYDGYWDCLAGTLVTGIKGRKEVIYRKGNVNITPDDIGALSIEDAALLQTDMDNAKSDVSELKTKTTNLQNNVSTNTSDISSLKSDMTTAKTDISNAKTNIANLQTDVGNIQSDVTDLQGDLQDYVNSLLQTISTLQDSVSFLQTMIYTGKALTYLVDDEGENIVTSDGSNIYAWWNIGD